MDKIENIRARINAIDEKMAELFEARMKECREVAEYKRANSLPILDAAREKEVIDRNSALVREDSIREYYARFQQELMSLSREYQKKILG